MELNQSFYEDFNQKLQMPTLNIKDDIIFKLQNQIKYFKKNLESYDTLLAQMKKLEARYSQLQNQYSCSKLNIQNRSFNMEKNSMDLKKQIDVHSNQLKSQQISLNQILADTQSLNSQCLKREEEIERLKNLGLNLKTDIDETNKQKDKLESIVNTLNHHLKELNLEKQTIQNSLRTINKKIENMKDFKKELLQQQDCVKESINRFTDENSKIQNEITALINIQNQLGIQISEKRRMIKEIDYSQSEILSQSQKYRSLIGQTEQNFKCEKQKNKELVSVIKCKQFHLSKLQSEIHKQHKQINYLLKKNNEIKNINERLNYDLDISLQHLQNLRKNNQELQKSVDLFRAEDKKIIEKIQNRTQLTQTKQKLDQSRVTTTSSKYATKYINGL